MTESINYEAVCRTASATPSLLITVRLPCKERECFSIVIMGISMEKEQQKLKTTVLTPSCQVYGKDLQRSGLLKCQGTLWNQSEMIRTPQDSKGLFRNIQGYIQGSGRPHIL